MIVFLVIYNYLQGFIVTFMVIDGDSIFYAELMWFNGI